MTKKDFENKMCQCVIDTTFITEVKYLTKFAGTHYLLLLERDVPLGIVQYTYFRDKYSMHNFSPMDGLASSYLLARLEKATELMNETLKDVVLQEEPFNNKKLLDLIDEGFWFISHETTNDELVHATNQNGTIDINVFSDKESTISFQTFNCMCVRKWTFKVGEYGTRWFMTKDEALDINPNLLY